MLHSVDGYNIRHEKRKKSGERKKLMIGMRLLGN